MFGSFAISTLNNDKIQGMFNCMNSLLVLFVRLHTWCLLCNSCDTQDYLFVLPPVNTA